MKVTITKWATGTRTTEEVSQLPTIHVREDGYQFLVVRRVGTLMTIFIPLMDVAGFYVEV